MSVTVRRLVPKSTYAERPKQAESMPAQFASLGMEHASPIEKSFAKALVYLLTDPREFGPPAYLNLLMPVRSVPNLASFPPVKRMRTEGAINVMPECEVGSYRVDFAFIAKAYGARNAVIKGAVECDGRDFHERTNDQIAYDRRRDRKIQEGGITVLRFPGSEIHADAPRCAREAINVLLRMSVARRK